MMPRPIYKHPIHPGSTGVFIGSIDVGDTAHDIWIVDDWFVERWSDDEKDAVAIEHPLTTVLLKQWALKSLMGVIDTLEEQVLTARRICDAIMGVDPHAHAN